MLDLCRGLSQSGHRVGVVVARGSPLSKHIVRANVRILPTGWPGASSILAARQLARSVDTQGWQVLNAHTPPDYLLASLVKRLARSRPRLVLTRHILLQLGRSFLHRWAFSLADAFIAVSHAVAESLGNHPLIDPGKIHVIYNGIDTDRFTPEGTRSLRERLGLAPEQPLVGIIGEVSPHKGQQEFLGASILLLERGLDAKFVLIGSPRPKNVPYLKRLKRIVQERGLGDHILFLDAVSDVPDAIRSLDVLVLASHEEPFGLITVEAMACGCPIVATSSGATPEIVTDGVHGILVQPRRKEAIASAVAKLIEDAALRARLGHQARERAVKHFGLERMVQQTESLYQKLLRHSATDASA